jgi:hypothetical protein
VEDTPQKQYDEMPSEMRDMIDFMMNRIGFDHFICAGYKEAEYNQWFVTKGLYREGGPKIAARGHLAGIATIIARLLTDFEFSYNLRRAVHSIVNTVETGREMRDERDNND